MLKIRVEVSEDSHPSDSPSEAAGTAVVAITGVAAAIVALSLAQALLAVGIVGLVWLFLLQARPLSPRWRPHLLVVSMVLSVAGVVLLIAPGDDGSPATTATSASPPSATPGTVTQSASPSKEPVPLPFKSAGSVTVTLPPRDEVPQCWRFHGDARLRAGRTLVVGARRVDPPDEFTYFDGVEWTGDVGQSKWSTARYFGTRAGQIYGVYVVVLTTRALEKILAAHRADGTAWRTSKLPSRDVAEAVQLPEVQQIRAPHSC